MNGYYYGRYGNPLIDGGGIIWTPCGPVWVRPWRPWELGQVSEGPPLGGDGDPDIEGGLGSGEHPQVLAFLDSLHNSLEGKSEESLQRARSEHSGTVARLYTKSARKSKQALRQRLASLQRELHRPGANKPEILREIADILDQLGE